MQWKTYVGRDKAEEKVHGDHYSEVDGQQSDGNDGTVALGVPRWAPQVDESSAVHAWNVMEIKFKGGVRGEEGSGRGRSGLKQGKGREGIRSLLL